MALHEDGVDEGDQQQETEAERGEDLTPPHGPDRRPEPGRQAEEGASAGEYIAGSQQTEATEVVGGGHLLR